MIVLASATDGYRARSVVDAPPHRPTKVGIEATVLQAQRGDRAAFELLYREFARVVHGIVLVHCGSAEAEDVTQDVFVTAFERLTELRDPVAFPAWLCTAARHAAIDHLRRRHRRPAAAELYDIAAGGASPAEAFAAEDAAARILAKIRQLGAAYRETLVLRLVEGLSGPEIARQVGMTDDSVRVNLHRGMKLLKEALAWER